MGDKSRPRDELENTATTSHSESGDAIPPLLRELARAPDVFAGAW